MNIEGAIFDLDGTVVDSLYVWNKVDIDFFKKRGMEVPKGYSEKIKSMSFLETAKYTKEEFHINESVEEIIDEWYNMAFHEYSNNVKLKANIKKYLKHLKKNKVKIGLATASPKILFEAALKNNEVYDYFDAFTSGSEVKRSKNFPDIYFLTAEKLNVKPEKCIVFEDIYVGIKGAKAAGMKAYGVFDKHSQNEKDKIKEISDGYIFDFLEMIK